jgi:hypothetical protein
MTKNKQKDNWTWPTSLLFLALIGLISYQTFLAIKTRQKLFKEMNTLQQTCQTKPEKAEVQLRSLLQEVMKAKSSNIEQLLALCGSGFPDINEHCAIIYKKLGDNYSAKNDFTPMLKNYSYCLAFKPDMKYVALDLGQACMKTKNYELGHYAGKLHAKENGGQSVLLKHFSKHYKQ